MALSANQNDLKLFKLLEGSKAYLVMSKQTPVQSSVKAVVPTSITVIYIFLFYSKFSKIFCWLFVCLYWFSTDQKYYIFGGGEPRRFSKIGDLILHSKITKYTSCCEFWDSVAEYCDNVSYLELVSKELNHLEAILHVYARGLNFM